MKRIATASLILMMTASLATANVAAAQPQQNHDRPAAERQDNRGPSQSSPAKASPDRDSRGWHTKSDYRKGGHVAYKDWQRGKAVDYRKYKRLSKPPKGHEWRKVDNRYVLVAVATGVIAAIVLSN
ncbi:MAG: RcnB family protein [Asticcacaulis sp.]